MNTNQKKGIVNRKIIPQTRLNMYPKRRFCGHIAGTCAPKGVFGYISRERVPEKAVLGIYWQGLMDSDHRGLESGSTI